MKKPIGLKKAAVLILLAIIVLVTDLISNRAPSPDGQAVPPHQIEQAFAQGHDKIQVTGRGTVVKLLADDLKGKKHQKFIVQITPELTVLISHNIDIAPRINRLKKGDTIAFSGVYVWNNKGGLIHWTHHDPGNRHPGGWIEHDGRRYD